MKTPCRLLFIYIAMICLVLSQYTTLYIPYISVYPDLPLLYLIYISLYFSGPLFVIFSLLIGILNDVIAGSIIGATSMEYTIVMVILQNDSKYFNAKSFLVIWLRAVILILLASSARALIYHYISSSWVIDITTLLRNLVSILSYPAVHLILNKILKIDSKVADAG